MSYNKEKEEKEQRSAEISMRMQRLQAEKAEGQEQIKRKYQPLIKEQKSRINQLEYELEKLERSVRKINGVCSVQPVYALQEII